jgi:hypothetical protein
MYALDVLRALCVECSSVDFWDVLRALCVECTTVGFCATRCTDPELCDNAAAYVSC